MTDGHSTYETPQDEYSLTRYDEEFGTTTRRRETSRQQANYLTIAVLKSYRKSLPRLRKLRQTSIKDLTWTLDMPVDIVFEIFQYLHPIDLLQLKTVNNSFRELLNSPSTDTVWKAAFENFPDIPKALSDISWLRWADLLFGAAICEKCGASPARSNLTLRQRLCYTCHQLGFISYTTFEEKYDEDVRELMIGTKVVAVDPFNVDALDEIATSWPLYKTSEADEIAGTLLRQRQDLSNNIEGAKEKLEQYQSDRRSHVKKHDEDVGTCLDWTNDVHQLYYEQIYNKVSEIDTKLKPRIKALKLYREADVDEAAFFEIVKELVAKTGVNRLTNKRFVKILPRLKIAVQEAVESRLMEERQDVITSRVKFVGEQYRNYHRTCLPATWSYMPPTFVVKNFPAFSEVINLPHNDPLTEEDLDEPFKLLPTYIDEWRIAKMNELASQLPSQQRTEGPSMSGEAVSDPDPDVMALDLATSVFHCLGSYITSRRTGGCLVGWDGAGPHMQCPALEAYWDNRLHFSPQGYDAATELVRLSGFDPRTAKIWDMDVLDPRFVCMTCPAEAGRNHGRKVWNWRESIYHYMKAPSETHTTPSYAILGPKMEADLKAREGTDPYVGDPHWSCNHCSEHYSNLVTRKNAIEHAREVHDVWCPIQNLDYIYHVGYDRTYPKPLLLPEAERSGFACLRCAPTKSRLYTEKVILRHLKDAHRQNEPVEDKDWRKFAIILRSTVEVAVVSSSSN